MVTHSLRLVREPRGPNQRRKMPPIAYRTRMPPGKSPVPGVMPKTSKTAPSAPARQHSLSKSASRRVPVSNREIVAPECPASFPA
jgi:hypothetical protein